MIQTAGLIALVGSLVAVAIPAFDRTLRRSKVAEASIELDRLHRAISAYYSSGERATARCLPEAAGPTPTQPSPEPVSVIFSDATQSGASTWKALAYEPSGAIRFAYSYSPNVVGCDLKTHGPVAVLRAEGDLDSDGERSLFERRVVVDREHMIVADDALLIRDRIE